MPELDLDVTETVESGPDERFVARLKLKGGIWSSPESWEQVDGLLEVSYYQGEERTLLLERTLPSSFQLSRMEYDRTLDTQGNYWRYRPIPFVSPGKTTVWIWNFIEKQLLVFDRTKLLGSVFVTPLENTTVERHQFVSDESLTLTLRKYGFDDYYGDTAISAVYTPAEQTLSYSVVASGG